MALTATQTVSAYDVDQIRADFPILKSRIQGRPLIYLDNGATTQKPQAVITALSKYYLAQNANIHRGVYALSAMATDLYEAARQKVQKFLNAAEPQSIIFTRGTTEAINLVASSYGRANLKAGDQIILSAMEHHSNIVPWQILCAQTGAELRVIPFNDAGELDMDAFASLLNEKTKIVSIVHLSNSLGTINPVARIIEQAHRVGAVVMVDGAQWVAHGKTDVQALDADFYAFSGHKIYGPTGIGVLYGKAALLEAMPPYQGGGDMISSVTFEQTTWNVIPTRFEAGTPNIAGAIGLGAAIDYVSGIGVDAMASHEQALLEYATQQVDEMGGIRVIGRAGHKGSVLSMVVNDPPMASLDVGLLLDQEGVAVRTGHHCCQPVMDRFGIPGTVRASLGCYNTMADVDALVAGLKKTIASQYRKGGGDQTGAGGMQTGRQVGQEMAQSVEASNAKPTVAQGSDAPIDKPEVAGDELIEAFEFLGDWETRHQFIIEMGEKMPRMDEALKMDANLVKGCQSRVWLWAHKRPGTRDVLDFVADSDAAITRGLVAMLHRIYSGRNAADILAYPAEQLFLKLDLEQHLSPTRRNGLHGMVQRIRALARALTAHGTGESVMAAREDQATGATGDSVAGGGTNGGGVHGDGENVAGANVVGAGIQPGFDAQGVRVIVK